MPFTPTHELAGSGSLPGKAPPFFVVGPPRAGTTVLRLVLGHHPEICTCDEMEFVTPPLAMRGGAAPDIDEYRRYLQLDRNFRGSGYRVGNEKSFFELARSFLIQKRAREGRRVVGAAVHHHFEYLPDVWKDAKYIYLDRDPRDIARSAVRMGWVGTAWKGANFWLAAEASLQRLRERVPADRILRVSFEEFVTESESVVRRICAFLDLGYDDRMMDIESDTTYRRPSPGEAKSWRDEATEWEVRQVEACVGLERLRQCSYEPSGHPILKLHPLNRARLGIAEFFYRRLARARKYGLRLWLADAVARRLPFEGLRNRLRFAIQDVDNSNLR